MSESKSHPIITPLKKTSSTVEGNFKLFKNNFMQDYTTEESENNCNMNQYEIKRTDSGIDPNLDVISQLNNDLNSASTNDIDNDEKFSNENLGKNKIDFKNFSIKYKPLDILYPGKNKPSLSPDEKDNSEIDDPQRERKQLSSEILPNDHVTNSMDTSSSSFKNNLKHSNNNNSNIDINTDNKLNSERSNLDKHTKFSLPYPWKETPHVSGPTSEQLHFLEKPLRRMSVLPVLHNFIPHNMKTGKSSISDNSKTSILSETDNINSKTKVNQNPNLESGRSSLLSPPTINSRKAAKTPSFENEKFSKLGLNHSDPKLAKPNEYENFNSKERRASDPASVEKSETSSPILHQNRRYSVFVNTETPMMGLRGRRMSVVSERSHSPSSVRFSLPEKMRRASMALPSDRPFPVSELRRRRSVSPVIHSTHYKNDNRYTKNKNTFKTFDFKSFQFPLSSVQEINGQESHFDDIPGKGQRSTVVREQKVKRDNGRNKVTTIEDDNDYDDISNDVHVNNIFTTLIEQEKKKDKEKEKHHHHHGHHDMIDYTSAVTGAFSDVMFNWNETANDNQSRSESESTSESYTSLYNINTRLSGDDTISNKENTVEMPTSLSTTHASTRQTPILNKTSGIRETKTHRHHKSLSENISKDVPYADDKKRLVYQFLQSLAPPSKNQLEKQGLLFTSENPLLSSQLVDKETTNKNSGLTMSSNRSLQSLLFHDLEQPEYLSDSTPPSPYSKSSYSLSSYSSSSYSSESSSSLSNSSKSNEDSSNTYGDEMDNMLDRYDVHYYQSHIALLLSKFDDIMKSHLKGAILKKETDFQRTLQTFDGLVDELQKLKKKTIDLETLIKNKYLVKLTEKFGDQNSDSFIEVIEKSVTQNIKQLEDFEIRMKKCQEKLNTQKRDLRQMDNLLQIEQSIVKSKKSLGFFSKYKYMVFDIISLSLIMIIVLICISSVNREITSYIFVS